MTGQGDKDLCLLVSFGVLVHVWMFEHAKNTKENQQWRSSFFAERHYIIIGIRQSSLRGEKTSIALYVESWICVEYVHVSMEPYLCDV